MQKSPIFLGRPVCSPEHACRARLQSTPLASPYACFAPRGARSPQVLLKQKVLPMGLLTDSKKIKKMKLLGALPLPRLPLRRLPRPFSWDDLRPVPPPHTRPPHCRRAHRGGVVRGHVRQEEQAQEAEADVRWHRGHAGGRRQEDRGVLRPQGHAGGIPARRWPQLHEGAPASPCAQPPRACCSAGSPPPAPARQRQHASASTPAPAGLSAAAAASRIAEQDVRGPHLHEGAVAPHLGRAVQGEQACRPDLGL